MKCLSRGCTLWTSGLWSGRICCIGLSGPPGLGLSTGFAEGLSPGLAVTGRSLPGLDAGLSVRLTLPEEDDTVPDDTPEAGRVAVEGLRSEPVEGRVTVEGLRSEPVEGRVTEEGLRSEPVEGRVAGEFLFCDDERTVVFRVADDFLSDEDDRLTDLPEDLCGAVSVVLEPLDDRDVPDERDSLCVCANASDWNAVNARIVSIAAIAVLIVPIFVEF